jgi:hypothetical protein
VHEVDDTSPQAEGMQLELYRRMTPGQKLALVLDLIDTAEEFSRAGLRLRHPQASEQELTRRLAALKYEHTSIPTPLDPDSVVKRPR